jgi:hypothetical protein
MPRYYVTDNGFIDPGEYVDVDAPPAAAGGAQLLAHPRYAVDALGYVVNTNLQRIAFIGFADRDYAAGEVFEHRWAVADLGGAVDVVFAEVGLCKQAGVFTFDPADPIFLNVIAARDVAAQIVAPGEYTAILEVSPIPDPQFITRGDPLWIVWSVTTTTTPPTLRANAADLLTPLCGGSAAVAWIPSNEIGAPASTFAADGDTPIAGLTRPPIP